MLIWPRVNLVCLIFIKVAALKIKTSMKYLFLILSIFLTNLSQAESATIYLGSLESEFGYGSLNEIGIQSEISANRLGSISVMEFDHKGSTYQGVNISTSLFIGGKLKAYSGIGGFFAKYDDCEMDFSKAEKDCTSIYTYGVYPELGILLSMQKLTLGAYGRLYKTFKDDSREYSAYGFKVGYEF